MSLRREDLLAFVRRPWAMGRRRKDRHWTAAAIARGPAAMLEAAEELRAHLRLVQPGWPSAEQRRADLQHHVRLKQLLDRYARAAQAKRRR